MEITQKLERSEIQHYEEQLTDARCTLEQLAVELEENSAEINGLTEYEIQDLADQIAEIENYLFEFLEKN